MAFSRRRLALLGALAPLPLLAGCNQPRVAATPAWQGGPLPRPDRILVHDFAVNPSEVRLDSGVRGQLTQALSGQTQSESQLQVARSAAAALAEALASGLGRYGIPVERTARTTTAAPGRELLVTGHLLAVDEGNRTRRRLIGFGRGMSSMEASAQLFLLERGPPRLIESFTADADSGYAPGAAMTMGAGAAAGRLATAAAVGGA
ncbi:MAG: DUF4410 domain-containing protein, partial [Acetobacteraceae bacterium]|nr:DUF4410 domain-containing protein [Acetobacteraceae bacterium]